MKKTKFWIILNLVVNRGWVKKLLRITPTAWRSGGIIPTKAD
jgi:hypothetical protein